MIGYVQVAGHTMADMPVFTKRVLKGAIATN
jgi:hypothetical protein